MVAVITGSTHGIGHGLAEAFMERGHQVVISGRRQESVNEIVEKLSRKFSPENILGVACDVTVLDQIQNLWQKSITKFNKIDYWINNAGISHETKPFEELDENAIQSVIQTNLIGVILGTKVALNGMQEQSFGTIFNMEGAGSSGQKINGLSIYTTSKRALSYFTGAIIEETKNGPVRVCLLSPGMVITDLLIKDTPENPEKWERQKKIFNILADKVETVTPYLVEKILENPAHGSKISWLTGPKILWRFVTAPFMKRDLFSN